MNYTDEQRITHAVRHHNAAALAEAVKRLPSYDRNFEDVSKLVEDAGGARYVRYSRIQMGDTTIENHLGRPVVKTATW